MSIHSPEGVGGGEDLALAAVVVVVVVAHICDGVESARGRLSLVPRGLWSGEFKRESYSEGGPMIRWTRPDTKTSSLRTKGKQWWGTGEGMGGVSPPLPFSPSPRVLELVTGLIGINYRATG